MSKPYKRRIGIVCMLHGTFKGITDCPVCNATKGMLEALKIMRKHMTSNQIELVLRDLRKIKDSPLIADGAKRMFYLYSYGGGGS